MKTNDKKQLTSENGRPIADNQNTQTAGPRGPVTLQDTWLLEKMAHFDRGVRCAPTEIWEQRPHMSLTAMELLHPTWKALAHDVTGRPEGNLREHPAHPEWDDR